MLAPRALRVPPHPVALRCRKSALREAKLPPHEEHVDGGFWVAPTGLGLCWSDWDGMPWQLLRAVVLCANRHMMMPGQPQSWPQDPQSRLRF